MSNSDIPFLRKFHINIKLDLQNATTHRENQRSFKDVEESRWKGENTLTYGLMEVSTQKTPSLEGILYFLMLMI